jgi:HCO3- transporter family
METNSYAPTAPTAELGFSRLTRLGGNWLSLTWSPVRSRIAGTRHEGRLVGHGDRSPSKSKWYRIKYFSGMVNDIKRRAPYYASDWTDAWDYRVIPATVYIYFAKYVANCKRHERSN